MSVVCTTSLFQFILRLNQFKTHINLNVNRTGPQPQNSRKFKNK